MGTSRAVMTRIVEGAADGANFYKQALKNTTTTNLTAEEIHQIGLKEVARIKAEMRQIMKKVNFKKDSLPEFFEFVRTDKQFTYPNTSAGKRTYLDGATKTINTMKGRLDELFLTKPKADMVVKAVEAYRAHRPTGRFHLHLQGGPHGDQQQGNQGHVVREGRRAAPRDEQE